MTYELVLHRNEDGSVKLAGDAPDRIRMSQELLGNADPAIVHLDPRGDVMFTLTNAVLWYRRVGPVDDGLYVEFERVA